MTAAPTFTWDNRVWCTQHPETCLSDHGASSITVRPCPHCEGQR